MRQDDPRFNRWGLRRDSRDRLGRWWHGSGPDPIDGGSTGVSSALLPLLGVAALWLLLAAVAPEVLGFLADLFRWGG